MTFAKFLHPFRSGIAIRLEVLSLFFAYAAFFAMYLVSSKVGGWKCAWLSGLFLSVMPASVGYDTWIKRDGLTSAFGYFSIFMLLKKKYFWCGVLLGLSLLSKENGIFFALASLIIIFLLKEKRPFKRIAVIFLTAFALSSWWYFFFSEMTTHGPVFFFTRQEYSLLWANPPIYYFKKLLPDLGTGILFFLIAGIIALAFKSYREKKFVSLVPLAIAACVYIPISFLFTLKAPWLFLPAIPALAMIAGSGSVYLLEWFKNKRFLRLVVCLLIALVVYQGITFSYQKYHAKTYPNGWPGALSSKKIAEYLNEHMKKEDRLMITDFSYWQMPYCPIFLYYSTPHHVKWIKGTDEAKSVLKEASENKTTWLVVIGSPDPKTDPAKLIAGLKESLGEPKIVGWSYIWHIK
jgi:4-amino-4-deoxy-L-arabinose transferase-like glycosyltransferase